MRSLLDRLSNHHGNVRVYEGEPPDGLAWITGYQIHWAAKEAEVPYRRAQTGMAHFRGFSRPQCDGIVVEASSEMLVRETYARRLERKDAKAAERKKRRLARYAERFDEVLPLCPPDVRVRVLAFFSSRYVEQLTSPVRRTMPSPKVLALYCLRREVEDALLLIDPDCEGVEESLVEDLAADIEGWSSDCAVGYEEQ